MVFVKMVLGRLVEWNAQAFAPSVLVKDRKEPSFSSVATGKSILRIPVHVSPSFLSACHSTLSDLPATLLAQFGGTRVDLRGGRHTLAEGLYMHTYMQGTAEEEEEVVGMRASRRVRMGIPLS